MRASAKLNLCLYLGPTRDDDKHELVSIFQPLDLADGVEVETGVEADEVICGGVDGENLAMAALRELRAAGWGSPPVRVTIHKRIPVAAGLGGGSADAAAVLRLALGEVEGLAEIAARIGADVPSQIHPAPALVGGAGEVVEPLRPGVSYGVVLIPDSRGLSTGEVYAEADRLGLQRGDEELSALRQRVRDAFGAGESPLDHTDLLVNDLQPAAISLMGEIEATLESVLAAGAGHAMVTGSGPTVVGLFGAMEAAERAAAELQVTHPGALATSPIRGF